jgi:imidazolonepropionase-like amidohydrolase
VVPLLALLAAAPLAVPGPVVRVFVGARVVDGTGAAPIEDAVFVVSEGRIQAIGPRGQVKLPEEWLVDLAGKTVIPG